MTEDKKARHDGDRQQQAQQSFKKIGIPAVAAATHVMKPRDERKTDEPRKQRDYEREQQG